MNEITQRIPELRKELQKISTQYSYESKQIGEAIALLSLLKDLIDGSYKDCQK